MRFCVIESSYLEKIKVNKCLGSIVTINLFQYYIKRKYIYIKSLLNLNLDKSYYCKQIEVI